MRKEVSRHIISEVRKRLDKGYSIELIKKLLSNKGYEKKVVNEILNEIIKKDAKHYFNKGHSNKKIKEILSNKGFSYSLVKKSIKELVNKQPFVFTEKIFLILFLSVVIGVFVGSLMFAVSNLDLDTQIVGYATFEETVSFDRDLVCATCGKHKAPPEAHVNMVITVDVSETLENVTLIDYFSNNWSIVDAKDGTVETFNDTYSKISWFIDNITDSVSKDYILLSPELTSPPTKYFFSSELTDGANQTENSGNWNVIISDPPAQLTDDSLTAIPDTVNEGDTFNVSVSYTQSKNSAGSWTDVHLSETGADTIERDIVDTCNGDNEGFRIAAIFVGGCGTATCVANANNYGVDISHSTSFSAQIINWTLEACSSASADSTYTVPNACYGTCDANVLNANDVVTVNAGVETDPPLIDLQSPDNVTGTPWTANNSVQFLFNTTDVTSGIYNCSVYTNESGSWQLEQSNDSVITEGSNYTITHQITEGNGVYLWNTYCYDDSTNRNLGWDDANWTVNLSVPITTYCTGSNPYNLSASDWIINGDTECKDVDFKVDGNITIINDGNLTLINTTIRFNSSCASGSGCNFTVQPGGELYIRDGDLDPSTFGLNDISVINVTNSLTISHYNFYGYSRNISLQNSRFEWCGNRSAGLEFAIANGTNITGNQISCQGNMSYALSLNTTSYANISWNNFTGLQGGGILLNRSTYNLIDHNLINGTCLETGLVEDDENCNGIALRTSSDENNVTYNDIKNIGQSGGEGIDNEGSLSSRFLYNNITAANNGVELTTNFHLFAWNIVRDNTADGFITGNSGDGFNISYNTFINNAQDGIDLNGADQALILGNNLTTNGDAGIEIDVTSNDNNITNNIVSDGAVGLRTDDGNTGNEIVNLTVTNTTTGIISVDGTPGTWTYNITNSTFTDTVTTHFNIDAPANVYWVSLNNTFNKSRFTVDSDLTGATQNNLTIKWYLRVNVTDQNGNVLNAASVNISDNSSLTIAKLTTGADGTTQWIRNVTEYWTNQTGVGSFNQSYQPTRFNASLVGYTENNTEFNITDTQTLRIILATLNTPPPRPNLTAPINGSFITDRIPYFNWTNVTDADNNDVTYDIFVDDAIDFTSPITKFNIADNKTLLDVELDVDTAYYWKVRAFDGTEYSTLNSTVFNFTVNSLIAISFVNNSFVNFTSLQVDQEDNTTDGIPDPFLIRNDGNTYTDINISSNASLWSSVGLGNPNWQIRARNASDSELGSYNFSASLTNYTNVTNDNQTFVKRLDDNNTADEVIIDVRVKVPADEPGGIKRAFLIFTAFLTPDP